MDFLGIGWEEMVVILIVILVIWGPGRLIEISRTLGKTVNAFKKAASDLSAQVTKELENQKDIPIDQEKTKNSSAPTLR